jgi:tRNA threonylcarbamoyladenosine biosynthesis protein TsaB
VIVAIDAASTDLSVAVVSEDGAVVAEDGWTSAQRQSAEVLPRLLDLLRRAGRSVSDVSAVAVGTGPGSFTGLRVAMALGKGLAVGLGARLVGVPSLGAWLATEPEAVAAVARAGAREAYLLERGAHAPRIVDRDALAAHARTLRVVAPRELAEAFGLAGAYAPRAAAAIARAAVDRLRADDADDVGSLEPIYVRAPRGVTEQPTEEVRWL